MKVPMRHRLSALVPSDDRLNFGYLIALYAMLGAGGSIFTALVIGAIGFSLFRLLVGRLPLTGDRMARTMAAAGVLYFLSGALMVVLQPGDGNLSLLWERAPFLGFVALFAQLRLSDRDTLRKGLEMGALIGAFGLAAWLAVELALFDGPIADFRAQGPSGNPGPLATTAAFLFAVNLFAVAQGADRPHRLAAAGALLAALAVGLSGMRTLLPALVLIPVVCLWAFPRARGTALRPVNLALAAAFVLVLAAVAGGLIAGRVADAFDYVADIGLQPSGTHSLGQRIAMWSCAWDAFQTSPLLGLGRSDALAFMTQCTGDMTGRGLVYGHYHNTILTSLAFGGVVELVATLALLLVPAYWAWRRRNEPQARHGCALIAAILIVFGLNGMANIMLDHDIHDALFIHATSVGLAMMAGSAKPEADGRAQSQPGGAG